MLTSTFIVYVFGVAFVDVNLIAVDDDDDDVFM